MPNVRLLDPSEHDAALAIINAAARRYRGVIPDDRWRDPYMTSQELTDEIGAGVTFWGADVAGRPAGVMGLQRRADVILIRHAYVLPDHQGRGVGGALLKSMQASVRTRMLVGAWEAAAWAVRFYERHGFHLVASEEVRPLLKRYWNVPERQMATSVVLTDSPVR